MKPGVYAYAIIFTFADGRELKASGDVSVWPVGEATTGAWDWVREDDETKKVLIQQPISELFI